MRYSPVYIDAFLWFKSSIGPYHLIKTHIAKIFIFVRTVFSAEFIWSLPTVPHIENFRQFEINCGFFQNRNQNQIEIFFGWFQVPYLLDRPGLGHHVQGEVYQVDDDMLALLGTIHILRSTCRVERVRKWKCLLIFSTKIMHRG